jgi:hypothetical protein
VCVARSVIASRRFCLGESVWCEPELRVTMPLDSAEARLELEACLRMVSSDVLQLSGGYDLQ